MSEQQADHERPCLHCMMVDLIDDFFAEYPRPGGGSDKVDTGEADEVIVAIANISKSSEEDNEVGELDKAEEVLSVVLPADEYATLPLYPGEEALDEPAPLVTA